MGASAPVRSLGEILVCQAAMGGDFSLPAGWAGREVLIATPVTDFAGARTCLAAAMAALLPWQVRPLALPSPERPTAQNLARAILTAAQAGAKVIYATEGQVWDDETLQELVAARIERTAAGSGGFSLQVVEHVCGERRVVAETPLDRLEAIMNRLLGEGGCPWDREQTHATLRPYIIEEAAEVIEAIERQDPPKLADELGDVLLQVAFHAALAARDGVFALRDVTAAIEGKMIFRHPHVFADWQVAGSDEVLTNWDLLKEREAAQAGAAEAGPWRPLRKTAVRACLAALTTAFAAARGDQVFASQSYAELLSQVERLKQQAAEAAPAPPAPGR